MTQFLTYNRRPLGIHKRLERQRSIKLEPKKYSRNSCKMRTSTSWLTNVRELLKRKENNLWTKLLTPGLDNARLSSSLTAGAGTRCMSLLSSPPSLWPFLWNVCRPQCWIGIVTEPLGFKEEFNVGSKHKWFRIRLQEIAIGRHAQRF